MSTESLSRRIAHLGATALAASLVLVPQASAAPPKADGAATGPFYEWGGPGETANVANWTAGRFGDEWDIASAGSAGSPGPRVWMNWSVCGLGAVVSEVRWQGARAASATSPLYAFRVTDTGATTYATSGNLRDDLAGAIYPTRRSYVVGTNSCLAQLRIDQVLSTGTPASDPAKRYWITVPRAIVRDVQAPEVQINSVPGGWLTGSTLGVGWTTSDNFEGSGILNQHVIVDGVGAIATGWHRQTGGIAADVSLATVPDGVRTLRVRAEGDGTAHTDATATVRVDRTPPAHGISVSRAGRGRVAVAVDVSDATSGTAAWSVLLPDGSIAASQATGTGPLANLDLSRFDGQDVVLQLVVRDVAGNEAQASSAPIVIDLTPPGVEVTPPAGWVAGLTEAEPLRVVLSDNRADGVGSVTVAINTAPDGSGVGSWLPLASLGQTPLGAKAIWPDLPASVGDGVHRIRVTAVDPRDGSLATTVETQIAVDTTSPSLGAPGSWALTRGATPTQASLALPDVADATSGVTAVRVFASTDPTGADRGTYRLIGSGTGAADPVTVGLSLAGLSEGRHATLVEAEDGAGNLTALSGPVVVVDRTPPIVAGVSVDGDGRTLSWRQSDASGFGSCPTVIEVSGVGTGGAWRKVHEVAGAAVPASGGLVDLPLRGMAAGDYAVRVTACDEAGNTASALARLLKSADGAVSAVAPSASSRASSRFTRTKTLESATERIVDLRIAGKTVTPGKPVVLDFGRPVMLTGVLERSGGDPRRKSWVGLTDPRRRNGASQYVSGEKPTFKLRLRPTAPGLFAVTTSGGGRAVVRVAIRAKLDVTVNRTRFALGQELVVSGRLRAGTGLRGKLLQLQWRDGTRWRPVANLSARADGRFAARYRFSRARGYSVAMRVVVPAERGWPLAAVDGTPFTVSVT